MMIVKRILPFAGNRIPGRRTQWLDCVAFAALLILGLTSPAVADSEAITLNIPAQPAHSALLDFARQAGVEISFSADEVGSVQANAVIGSFSPEVALRMLLAGTGLQASFFSSKAVTVRRAGVGNESIGAAFLGRTALRNDYLASASSEQREPSLSSAEPQSKNTSQSEQGDRKEEKLQLPRIQVTGSRIRGPQNASPLITISRAEIDRAGYATVEEIFDDLPQNFGAGATLDFLTAAPENFDNIVGGEAASARAGGSSVNLRGLGPGSTLILLNGHRVSPSGIRGDFTSTSFIPVTAIDRIEILTDGASAIYGSDAIGGVINFILRENYDGIETRLRYGSAKGDKPERSIGQTFGKSWHAGSVLFSYEYFESDSLANTERDITSTNDLSRFGGTDWRAPGGNPANIRVTLPDGTNQLFAIPRGQDGTSLSSSDFNVNAPLNAHNERVGGDIIPEQERHSAFLHFAQEIGAVEVFGEAIFSSWKRGNNTSVELFDIDVPASNAFFVDPSGTGASTVRVDNYSFEDDFAPRKRFGEIDTYGSTLGGRFAIGDRWNADLKGSWFSEEAISGNDFRIDRDALGMAVNQSDSSLAFNPFGDGSNTNAAVLDGIGNREPIVFDDSENELLALNLDFDGALVALPGGDAQLATGVELRSELLIGITNPSVDERRQDLDRDVVAVYAEFFIPIVGSANRKAGIHRLELSVAGRHEDYSDFGTSTDPKVGVAWSPTRSLTLRGTFGTSFKAPGLADLDPSIGSVRYIPQFFVDIGLVPTTFISINGNNADLGPEEATTWTAGVDWNPVDNEGLSLQATYYRVDYEDRIAVPTTNILTGILDPRFEPLRTLNPTQEQIAALATDPRWVEDSFGFSSPAEDVLSGVLPVGGIVDLRLTNLAQLVVSGVDLQLAYNVDTPVGVFAFGFNGSYMFDFERRLIDANPLVDEIDTLGRPVDFRARGNITWNHARWSIAGFVNYIDDYTDITDSDLSVDSLTTLDLNLAYHTDDTAGVFSNTRVSFVTQNLLDEDPPFVDTIGGVGFDRVNHDPIGRFFALRITKEW